MDVHQIGELNTGTSVWVWIVRVGKGRWWPGTVLSITAREPFPIIDTRFECRSTGKNGIDGPVFVGISTSRMRYLELRNPHRRGDDRPTFVPSAILAKPEENEAGLNDVEQLETTTADNRAAQASPATPVKKSRSRKKAKVSNSTLNATEDAIET